MQSILLFLIQIGRINFTTSHSLKPDLDKSIVGDYVELGSISIKNLNSENQKHNEFTTSYSNETDTVKCNEEKQHARCKKSCNSRFSYHIVSLCFPGCLNNFKSIIVKAILQHSLCTLISKSTIQNRWIKTVKWIRSWIRLILLEYNL